MVVSYERNVYPSSEEKKLRFSLAHTPYEEKASGALLPLRAFGFCEEGGLVSADGFVRNSVYAAPSPPLRGYAYGAERFFCGEDNKLYRLTALGYVAAAAFSAPPRTAEVTLSDHKRGLLFFNGGEWYVFSEGTMQQKSGVFAEYAAFHYERLFVWDGEKLRFSATLDPFRWTQGLQDAGYAYLPSAFGEVCAMLSFGERLYLFRDAGVTVFRAFGDNRNFKAVEKKFACRGVVGDTVCSTGDGVCFLADDGIYRFDGEDAVKIFDVRMRDAEASFFGGKYVLSGSVRGERVLLVFSDGKTCIYRADAHALSGDTFYTGDRWLSFAEGIGSQPTERSWESGMTEFGLGNGRKMLKKVELFGRGEISFAVRSEHGKRSYTARLPHCFRPYLRGRRFALRIEAFDRAKIEETEVTLIDY